jgi:phage shock protein C
VEDQAVKDRNSRYGGRDRAEEENMNGAQYHWSQNPLGLYRDVQHGRIAGVCAGLGAYLSIKPKYIRLAAILGCVFGFFVPIIAVYVALAILLKPMPEVRFHSEAEERFWRTMSVSPNRTASDLTARFRALDRRLRDIETRVTSEEFNLRQKFRDLHA